MSLLRSKHSSLIWCIHESPHKRVNQKQPPYPKFLLHGHNKPLRSHIILLKNCEETVFVYLKYFQKIHGTIRM